MGYGKFDSSRSTMKKFTSVDELRWAAQQIDRDVGIAQEIYDRWPNLRLRYLDPDKLAHATDKPYTVWELCSDGEERIVFGCDRIDSSIITRLQEMNQASIDIDEIVKKAEAKYEKETAEKEAEQDGQDRDFIATGVKHFNSGKLKYRYTDEHGEKRVIQ